MTSSTTEQKLIAPESGEHEALAALSRLLGSDIEHPLRLVTTDGSEIELPHSLRQVLQQAATALASDHTVAVEPFGRFVSIADAARLLNVSVEAVATVIERGELVPTFVEGRQMLAISDIVVWGAQHHAQLLKGLDELTQMSQELGLYDLDRS